MKLKNNIRLLITCDSGAGTGKTTAAKYLSKRFGLNYLTSGLLYRYVAMKILVSKKRAFNISFLKKITRNISSRHLKNHKLYSPEVTEFTSKISKIKRVRMQLRDYQRKFAAKRLAILEGRDMHLSYRVDVTRLLKKEGEENELELRFSNAPAYAKSEMKRIGYKGNGTDVHFGGPERLFVRKAQYHWGWDVSALCFSWSLKLSLILLQTL